MVANGHLETPSATFEFQFKNGYILFKRPFIVVTNLTRPRIGLLFLQTKNSTIFYMSQLVLNLPFLFMQLKHAMNTYSDINEPLLNPTEILFQPSKQTVIHNKPQVYNKNEVTSILQQSPDLDDNDDLSICPTLTTTQNRQNRVIISSFLEHQHTLENGCHLAVFSILTPKQAKYIKPDKPVPLRHLLDTNNDDAIH